MAMTKVAHHRMICDEINELYAKKNHDYGDSFAQSFREEGMAMVRIRLGDKFNRLKALTRGGEQKVADESKRLFEYTEASMFSGFSEEEILQFENFLNRIIKNGESLLQEESR